MRLSVLLSPDITTRSITACFQFHCWTAASQIQQRKYFFISNYCIKRITGKLTNVKKTEGRKSCTVWVTVEEDEQNVFENVTQEHNSMSPVWFCQNDSEQQTVFVYKKISCWCFRSNVFTEKGRREFLVSNESDYWWSQCGRKYVIFSPLTDVETCWNIQGEYFWSGPQFSQRSDGLVRSCVQKQQWEAQSGRVRMKPANISKYISSEF